MTPTPSTPYEVHFVFDGEPFVDTYATPCEMRERVRELLVEERLPLLSVRTHERVLQPIRRPVAEITDVVARRYGVTAKEVRSGRRFPALVRARDEIAYTCAVEGWPDSIVSRHLRVSREAVTVGVGRYRDRTGAPVIEERLDRGKQTALMSAAADRSRRDRSAEPRAARGRQLWWQAEGREALLRRLWRDGAETKAIAAVFGDGLTPHAIRAKAARMGLPPRGPGSA